MTIKDVLECEKKSFHDQMKGLKLLPNTYFKLGIIISVIAVILMIALKYIGDLDTLRLGIKNVLLLSLLTIAISRGKEEDELTLKLRAQAFALAFIWGVAYVAFQPILEIIANFILRQSEDVWEGVTAYEALFSMLLVQIGFYHMAKRLR